MKSRYAGICLIINLIVNFSNVFVGSSYWNKAGPDSPAVALFGYVIGGLSWFTIPSSLPVTMAFAYLAVETLPNFQLIQIP